MSEGIAARLTCTLLLLLIICNGYPQDAESQPVRIMFYNVENFFDIFDDTLTGDDDFLPDGVMRWGVTRYNRKLGTLYKTIIAAGEWEPPSVVALCEIENRKVLEDLLFRTYLSKYDYSIIHNDSPDPRGIDVCLIYRKDIVKITGYRYLKPARTAGSDFSTRSILMVKCIIGDEMVHLFVNHWPSRRGGILAAEDQRKEIAGMVKQSADSIAAADSGNAKIIIVGDFNATPGDPVMRILTEVNGHGAFLINLSEQADREQGTYRYMGMWEMIDQVIVSQPLLDSETGLYTDGRMFRVFKPGFLLGKDPKYPGLSPLPTYRGYRYLGGFSDHLPVLLDLGVRLTVPKE